MTEKQQLWYARYLDFMDSGLSQRQWCKENQISTSSLTYWIKIFGRNENAMQVDTNKMWVEVKKTTPITTQGITGNDSSTIRIALGELKIEVPPDVNPNILFKLVEGLGSK